MSSNRAASGANASSSSSSSADEYVRLISNDGFEFVVRRGAATASGTIRRMLEGVASAGGGSGGGFKEASENRVCFDGDDGLPGIVLEKVCEYMYYNERNRELKDVPDMDVPAELCLQLLMAADYLEL